MAIDSNVLKQLAENHDGLTSLDLSYLQLTEKDLDDLMNCLEKNTHLESLNLSGNVVSEKITKRLTENKILKKLVLIGCGIDDFSVQHLANNQTLIDLNLTNNEINDIGAMFFEKNTNLKTLLLKGNTISDNGATALARNITLTKLDLSHNKISQLGFKAFENNNSIVEFSINYNNMRNLQLSLIAQNKIIKKLELAGNSLDSKDVAAFVKINTTILSCDFSFCQLNDSAIEDLAKHHAIQELHLSYNRITHIGAEHLSRMSHLQRLFICYNCLKNEGAVVLAKSLTLTCLDLTGNGIDFNGARALALNQNLRLLALSDNSLDCQAAAVFSVNTTLKKLYLNYNLIKKEGAIALSKNVNLEVLSLNYNYIDEEGIRALKSNKTFKKLSVSIEQPPEFTDENLRTIFLLSESYLCITNFKGIIQFFNPAFARSLGYAEADLLSEPILNFIHPHDRAAYQEVTQKEERFPIKGILVRFICKDFSIIYINISLQLQHKRIYSVGLDVTEQKRADLSILKANQIKVDSKIKAAEEFSQKQVNFIAHLSHELRNSLGAADSTLDLMQEKFEILKDQFNEIANSIPADKSQKMKADLKDVFSMLRDVSTCIEHSVGIVVANLDLAKLSMHKLVLNNELFSINKSLYGIVSAFSKQAQYKGLEIVIQFPIKEFNALGDVLRIRQIIVNLLSNAIKFSEKGKICISLTVESESKDNLKCNISIADEGIGMTAEEVEKIFKDYTQAGRFISHQYGGSGIGLALSKELAKSMGGDITVKSEKGKGTIFTVTLVLKVPTLTITEEEKPKKIKRSFSFFFRSVEPAKKIILIVDDSDVNRKILEKMLADTGFVFQHASNGKEAVDCFEKNKKMIASIFMDINMPIMNGLSATQEIRQIEARERLSETPIIGITAEVLTQQEIAKEIGMTAFILKPFKKSIIFDTLESVLKQPKKFVSTSPSLTLSG